MQSNIYIIIRIENTHDAKMVPTQCKAWALGARKYRMNLGVRNQGEWGIIIFVSGNT